MFATLVVSWIVTHTSHASFSSFAMCATSSRSAGHWDHACIGIREDAHCLDDMVVRWGQRAWPAVALELQLSKVFIGEEVSIGMLVVIVIRAIPALRLLPATPP